MTTPTVAADERARRAADLIDHYDLDNRDELGDPADQYRYLLIRRCATTRVYHGSYHSALWQAEATHLADQADGWQIEELADLDAGIRYDALIATLRFTPRALR